MITFTSLEQHGEVFVYEQSLTCFHHNVDPGTVLSVMQRQGTEEAKKHGHVVDGMPGNRPTPLAVPCDLFTLKRHKGLL